MYRGLALIRGLGQACSHRELGPTGAHFASCSWLPHIVEGAVASLAMLGLRSGHCQSCSLPSLSLSGCLGRYGESWPKFEKLWLSAWLELWIVWSRVALLTLARGR